MNPSDPTTPTRPPSRLGRRGGAWLLIFLALLATARVVVALPEDCDDVDATDVDAAIDRTVTWFDRNQLADGRWLYRYDASTDTDVGGYNWVRHAGVLLSLEQAAHHAPEPTATIAHDVATRGWEAARAEMIDVTLENGPGRFLATTGGTALAGVALAERRERLGDDASRLEPDLDAELAALVRMVSAQVTPEGSVINQIDPATGLGIPGATGTFSTGQALFLMYRAARLVDTPSGPLSTLLDRRSDLEAPAQRIGEYIANDRPDAEGFVPDTSDHWAAYGYADLANTPGSALTDDDLSFARKQIGLAGVQVRYESQRTDSGIDRWLRGRRTLPAGLGTLGESLAGWYALAGTQSILDPYRAGIAERFVCTTHLLVDRQIDDLEAQQFQDPDRVAGAWLQFGITQMDDQQHALSSLVLAQTSGVTSNETIEMLPRRATVPESAILVILAAVVLLNPLRLARRARGCDVARPTIAGIALLGGATALGGPLLDAIDTSPATAVVAGGLVTVVVGAWGVLGRSRSQGPSHPIVTTLEGVARPETLLASLAIGAGGQGWTWIATVAMAGLAGGILASRPEPASNRSPFIDWGLRALGVLGVLVGVALVVEGVYAA